MRVCVICVQIKKIQRAWSITSQILKEASFMSCILVSKCTTSYISTTTHLEISSSLQLCTTAADEKCGLDWKHALTNSCTAMKRKTNLHVLPTATRFQLFSQTAGVMSGVLQKWSFCCCCCCFPGAYQAAIICSLSVWLKRYSSIELKKLPIRLLISVWFWKALIECWRKQVVQALFYTVFAHPQHLVLLSRARWP